MAIYNSEIQIHFFNAFKKFLTPKDFPKEPICKLFSEIVKSESLWKYHFSQICKASLLDLHQHKILTYKEAYHTYISYLKTKQLKFALLPENDDPKSCRPQMYVSAKTLY